MLVSEIMTTKVRSVPAMASPRKAIELMTKGRLTSLPVVDEDGNVVGVLSEADLVRVDRHRDTRAHLRPATEVGRQLPQFVQDLMTHDPHTVTEETEVAEIVGVFGRTTWNTLPVLRGRALVGMVSRSDVARSVAAADALVLLDVNQALGDAGGEGSNGWYAAVDDGVVQVTGPDSETDRDLARYALSTVTGVRTVVIAAPAAELGPVVVAARSRVTPRRKP